MKLVSEPERAVIQKDFKEVWSGKMARSTMIALPVILSVALPALYLVLILSVPMDQINGMDKMVQLLPPEARSYTEKQSMFYLLTNTLCPMFFLMIPLMMSSVSAASSFVGERERGTMETLLLTPLSMRQVFRAKVLGCVLLSAVSTGISFFLFAVVISVGDILLGMPFFLNWNWLVLLLFLSPSVTVFGVIFMVMVSGRSKSYIESFQTSGYLVLPVILLFVGQFTGLFRLSAVVLLLVSAGVAAVDVVLLLFAARSFTAEKLLR